MRWSKRHGLRDIALLQANFCKPQEVRRGEIARVDLAGVNVFEEPACACRVFFLQADRGIAQDFERRSLLGGLLKLSEQFLKLCSTGPRGEP